MNDTTENNSGGGLTRLFALIGLVVLICLLAWVAVQVVRLMPSAFSSLAQIFESNQRELHDRANDNDDNDDNVVIPREDEENNEGVVIVKDDEETVKPVSPAPTSTTPVKPTVTPKPATPQYQTVAKYVVPVSNPNGYTDLMVSSVNVGHMTNDGRFLPATSLSRYDRGAIQFKVTNIGTKTSGSWYFNVELPTGGEVNSNVQRPLGPSESAILTVAFEVDDRRGKRSFEIKVTGGNDVNTNNNHIRSEVSF